MHTQTAEEIYERYVRDLPAPEQLRLLAIVAHDLAEKPMSADKSQLNIMGLHGLGKEIWQGIDAQEYVNQLRDEWDDEQQ